MNRPHSATLRNFILAATALAALKSGSAAAQDPTGKYADSPNAAWFGRQYNLDGGFCCSLADGHLYYGDYLLNPDGSVTVPLATGGSVLVNSNRAHGTWDTPGLKFGGHDGTIDPNPTGAAVIWYTGTLTAGISSNVYCMALGALT